MRVQTVKNFLFFKRLLEYLVGECWVKNRATRKSAFEFLNSRMQIGLTVKLLYKYRISEIPPELQN